MKRINQILIFMIVSLMALAVSVNAHQRSCINEGYDAEKPDGGVGDPDQECQAHGFDFGIAKFECGNETASEGINVDWTNCDLAAWTANPAVDGVLSKEGNCYQYFSGGAQGVVDDLTHDISHITLCGNEELPPPAERSVPEFGVVAAGLALAGAGVYIARKRRK